MRKTTIGMATAAVLLAGAGTALADHGFGGDLGTVKTVTATFTATTATNVRTTTCTGSDGATYAITRAEYTGTATSAEPTLNGNATVDVNAVIDTTHDVGTVSGSLRIATSGNGHTDASFDSVYGGGKLAGLAEGKGHGDGDHGGGNPGLIANLSAGFSPTGGFTNGQLGGTTGGGAVLVSRGSCQQGTQTTPRTERIDVRGVVSAVSSSSITAAGVTCTVPSSLASAVANVKVNDFVHLSCTAANGTNTLTSVGGEQDEKGPRHH